MRTPIATRHHKHVESAKRGLVRRADHRLVAGVAGGLADHTGTRPGWWRAGFVLMTLFGGLGVLMYLLLWWVVPRADLPTSAGQRFARHFPDAPAWAGVALLMIGAVLLAGQLGLWRPTVGWAFLLIGLGVVLYRREAERRQAEERPDAAIGGTDESGPAPSSPASMGWSVDSPPPPPWTSSGSLATEPRAPRPPRERSWLGWLSFGLVLVAGGVLWLLRDSGVAHPSLQQTLALPLAVLGIGLLVGSFVGRARWTILPGIALVPTVLAASVITVPLNGVWTNTYVTPRTAAELRSDYQQSGANLVIDLTRLRAGEHPGPVSATLGIGDLQVVLPKGMPARIRASAGVGEIQLFARSESGVGISDELEVPGPSPIEMTLEVGAGHVSVYYEAVNQPRVRAQHQAATQ